MPGIKELKTRIKSIGSTRKITKAMQMVSAAKMRKAQTMALASRTYAEAAWGLIQNIANTGSFNHPLIKNYLEAKKIGVIVISSNKGLVGSLNTNLFTLVKKQLGGENVELVSELITYGKKSSQTISRFGMKIIADFPKQEKTLKAEDIYPIAQMITQIYSSGEYNKIYLAYNEFVSTLSQKPKFKQILPFSEKLTLDLTSEEDELEKNQPDYVFEPTPEKVLEHLLPRIIESQIYEAILESDASEHSARMVMMKNATEAAGDLITDLTLTYNQLRQNKITTELSEITAGRIALE